MPRTILFFIFQEPHPKGQYKKGVMTPGHESGELLRACVV
jgi:hypothetical protein